MKLQMILAVVFFCSTFSAVFGEEPLQVSLFYESYCPDCIQFVEEQLMSVYKLFVDHFQLYLLPYGNAHQRFVDGHWVISCQHGQQECLANKLHACAIYQACGDTGTVSCAGNKVSQVLAYISCVMKHKDQLKATSQCAKSSKLDANHIISCAKADKGDELLNFYGNRTENLAPWKEGVPAVAINGEHDSAAEDNLMDRLCQLKPSVCSHATTEPEVVLVKRSS